MDSISLRHGLAGGTSLDPHNTRHGVTVASLYTPRHSSNRECDSVTAVTSPPYARATPSPAPMWEPIKEETEMTVKLEHAMLCWDVTSQKAAVVRHPDYVNASDPYLFTTGACWVQKWPNMSEEERLLILIIDAWQAVIRDGMTAEVMHRALCAIPEFAESIASDVPGSSNTNIFSGLT